MYWHALIFVAPFSSVDERAALAAIRAEKNETRRNALIGQFVLAKEALIRKLSEKYAGIEKTAASLEDVYQAGRVGMMRALETWDPDAGAISTWAGWKIRREVQDLAHAEQPIKLPQIRGTKADRDRIIQAVHANPDVTAAELGIPEGMLERVKKTTALRYVSVDMFTDRDEAPARARRIEKRITDAAEVDGVDDELDQHRAARAVLAAIRTCASVAHMAIEDVIAGAARALGCEAPKTTPIQAKPRTKKAPDACPSTPKSPTLPRLRPSPLPPPRLLARAPSEAPAALLLRRPSAPLLRRAPLRLLSRPLPRRPLCSPAQRPCPQQVPCSTPTALCPPRSASSCETTSTLRKAA